MQSMNSTATLGQSSLKLICNIAMGRYQIYQWIVGSFVSVAFDDQQSNQICILFYYLSA